MLVQEYDVFDYLLLITLVQTNPISPTTSFYPFLEINFATKILTLAPLSLKRILFTALPVDIIWVGLLHSFSLNASIFALKFILIIALLVFVRGGIPRYRYDFLTKLG